MRTRVPVALFLAAGACLFAAAAGHAQLRRPTASVTPLVERDAVAPGGTVRLALQVALPDELHVQSNAPKDPTLVPTVLMVTVPPGVTIEEIVYPAATDFEQAGLDEPLVVFPHQFVIGVRLAIAAGTPPGDIVLSGRLRYQACDALMCYAPATVDTSWTVRVAAAAPAAARFSEVFSQIAFGSGTAAATPEAPPAAAALPAAVAAPAGTELPAAAAPEPASAPATGDLAMLDGFDVLATEGGYLGAEAFLRFIDNAERGVTSQGMFEGRGPLAILLIVFLGGLALNLTPCVLPMIPINLAIIGAGAQAGSRSRGFLLGSTYGSAMALVYGGLGLIVILTAGTFGTINASPWFNAAIALVFVVLALAMFDVIPIDFSRFSTAVGTGGAGRGTFALAFTMGAIAALLAGACVAPVVIQVVLFASNLYATGTTIALALPFVLGLGMAVPWPLAGAGIAALPKPGAWMVRVKQAFGVLILGTAVYYGYLAYTLMANRWVDSTAVASSVQDKLKEGWHASLADGLAVARLERKPVLVDLWATWCKNCLTMDRTTLRDPAVTEALSGYVKIKVQAEDPDAPATKALMQRFKAVGLPTYVILRPRDGASAP